MEPLKPPATYKVYTVIKQTGLSMNYVYVSMQSRICWTKEDNLYNCFLLEQKLIEENKEFLYQPTNLTIGGKTECISKEIINDF